MRLWSLHPKYLDQKGLVALWREALLAQAVLRGETHGYRCHPQLIRFREAPEPLVAIAAYLDVVQREAASRGYAFDRAKVSPVSAAATIPVPIGQLEYEWGHLRTKLKSRAPLWLEQFAPVSLPDPHPLFYLVSGPRAYWERGA